jgi:hypothetical protein
MSPGADFRQRLFGTWALTAGYALVVCACSISAVTCGSSYEQEHDVSEMNVCGRY